MARILVVDPEPTFSHDLSELMQHLGDEVVWVGGTREALKMLPRDPIDLIMVDDGLDAGKGLTAFASLLRSGKPPLVLMTSRQGVGDLIEAAGRGVACQVIKPYHPRELVSSLSAILHQQRRIVSLGGGTGLYTLLMGLKRMPFTHLTSVVNMSDDGGSTGRIRESFGVLPPGDVRRSLVALSSAPAMLNDLIQYRFLEGKGLKDHNLGNLLLTAVANLKGSMAEAVRAMSDILNIEGIVLPVTTTLNTLVAEFEDGRVVRGESKIDVPVDRNPALKVARVWQEPEAKAEPNAIAAILAADLITIGPGDLYTSIAATLAVNDIGAAIQASKARKVYICNLMSKPGETSGLTAADHVREIVRYLGRDVLDTVLVSNTRLSADALRQYADNGQEPVRAEDRAAMAQATKAKVLLRDIGSERELVRHHSEKLAMEVFSLLDPPPDGAH